MGFQLDTRETGRVIVVEAAGRFTLTDGQTKLRDLIHVFAGYGWYDPIPSYDRWEER